MSWRLTAATYLVCASTFWLVEWVQGTWVWGTVLFLCFALILLFHRDTGDRRRRVAAVLLFLGAGAMTYNALCFGMFFWSTVHSVPVFGAPLVFLFRLFGYAATSRHGMLQVSDEWTSYSVSIDSEKLGLIHGGALIAACLFLALFLRPNARRMVLFFFSSLIFLCLRFVLLVILSLYAKPFSYELEHFSLFWSTPFLILTLAPIMVLSRSILASRPPEGSFRPGRRTLAAAGALFLAFVSLQAALWLELPGERKQGRVLLDDYYSDVWETSAQDFTPTVYGRETVYNMAMGRKYLEHFYDVRVNLRPISRATLADVDVLILKTPIYRFSDTTLDAIEKFVLGGGGLLLIGDHTDLMGMTSHLNDLSRRFGIEYRFDATYDLTTGHDNHSECIDLFRPPVAPSLAGVRMMTTCTMDISPFLVRPISWVQSSMADEVDYSRPSFFGKMEADLADGFGSFVLGSVRSVESGKVAAICESTIFSNFGVFTSDREEWLRHLVELVNSRANPLEPILRIAALFLFLLLFAAACLLLRRQLNAGTGFAVSIAVTAGLWFGIWTVDRLGPDLDAHASRTPIPRIYFQRNGTTFNLPDAMAHYHADDADAFETMYVNVARLGYMPHEVGSISSAAAGARGPLVLIQPAREAFSDTLLQWIAAGGRAMIFLKDSAGIRQIPPSILPSAPELRVWRDSVTVRYVLHEKGRIAYLTPAAAFSRSGIGNIMEIPTTGAQAILDIFYRSVQWLGNDGN